MFIPWKSSWEHTLGGMDKNIPQDRHCLIVPYKLFILLPAKRDGAGTEKIWSRISWGQYTKHHSLTLTCPVADSPEPQCMPTALPGPWHGARCAVSAQLLSDDGHGDVAVSCQTNRGSRWWRACTFSLRGGGHCRARGRLCTGWSGPMVSPNRFPNAVRLKHQDPLQPVAGDHPHSSYA